MRKVLVTTKHRGVFFGELIEENGEVVDLANARNVVYWAAETRGFLGLAANGPAPGSRVGPAVKKLRVNAVTSIAECSDEAAAAMEAGPWK